MNEKKDSDSSSRTDPAQALQTDQPTQRRIGTLPIDRREYLKYTSALAGGSVAASQGALAMNNDDGGNDDDASNEFAIATNLQVDYEREPNNLLPVTDGEEANGASDERSSIPHFTWEVAGQRGIEQSAYRILVANQSDEPEVDEKPVWDSGRVESSHSINVPYDGAPLEPDTTYSWRVRLWDADGNASDWSKPAQFTTAIPDIDEYWEGEWIGPEYDEDDESEEWIDYTFEAEFTIVAGAAGFIFRASDTDDLYMWQIALKSHPNPQVTETALRPHVRVDGSWTALEDVPLKDVFNGDEHDRHHVEIDVAGYEITTSIDGEVIDTRTNPAYSAGTIGFRQASGERVRVHDVMVTDPVGDVLFEGDFSGTRVENFTGGTIANGALDLDGTGVVLQGDPFNRPSPLLRRDITLEKEVAEARLHASGVGYYELYVNGERVGDRVLEPGISNYEETVLYSTYDVTDHVSEGENALGIVLGRGWFGLPTQNTWNWHEAPWWGDPRLLIQCTVEFEDGTETTIVSDENWTTTDGPTRFDCLFAGEVYDAREEKSGWTEPGYDDEWENVTIVDAPGGSLVPQRVQPIEVTNTIEPVEMWEPKEGVYVFDVGQMIAGWPELSVEGPEGTEVQLTAGETLHNDRTVSVDQPHIQTTIQTNSYVLSGDGIETWEPRFTYHGFRYVQVEGFPGEPSLDTVRANVVHTVIEKGVESDFTCSNELLTQIHENTRQAMLNNLHSVHTDTPTWEKAGWTETKIEMGPSLMYNFWMPRFWKKFLRDAEDEQRENGMIPYLLPTSGWGYGDEFGEFGYTNDPGWDAAIVIVPWYAYEYYGDERFLADHYEMMKRYVEYVRDDSDDHIVWSGLGDYIAPGYTEPPEGGGIVSTTLYYRSAEIVADAAGLLGREDDEAEFRELAETIQTAFNDEFFDPDENVYRTGQVDEYRQTSNVYPVAFQLVPEGQEDAVVENLVHDILETHDGHLNVGAHGLQYLLPVLTEHGYLEVAYTVATQTTYPSWGLWIENGVTALLEMWNLDARSRSHDFLGSIDEWFYRHLAGITPSSPGFESVSIKPYIPDDLESAGATTDTVRGQIASRWERVEKSSDNRQHDGLALKVTIPGNSSATVEIPTLGGETVRVRENGKPIWNNGNRTRPNHPGIEDVSRKGDRVVVEAGAGEYEFELEQFGAHDR